MSAVISCPLLRPDYCFIFFYLYIANRYIVSYRESQKCVKNCILKNSPAPFIHAALQDLPRQKLQHFIEYMFYVLGYIILFYQKAYYFSLYSIFLFVFYKKKDRIENFYAYLLYEQPYLTFFTVISTRFLTANSPMLKHIGMTYLSRSIFHPASLFACSCSFAVNA